jgi:hypothetical protein
MAAAPPKTQAQPTMAAPPPKTQATETPQKTDTN